MQRLLLRSGVRGVRNPVHRSRDGGRKARRRAGASARGAAGTEAFDVEESLDVEFNATLRSALVVLAQEMLVASPGVRLWRRARGDVRGGGGGSGNRRRDGGGAKKKNTPRRRDETREDEKKNRNRLFDGVMAGARDVFASFGAFGSTDMDDDDKITGKAQVRPGDALEDMVYATFIAHHSGAGREVPLRLPHARRLRRGGDRARRRARGPGRRCPAARPRRSRPPRTPTATGSFSGRSTCSAPKSWTRCCASGLETGSRRPRERRRIDRRRFFREGYVVLVKNIRIRSRGDDDARAAVRLTRRS